MKKTLLALSVLFASSTAFATQATLEQEESIKASGTAMLGAYSHSGLEDKVYNGGATGVDIQVDYRQGNFVAQYGVEVDLDNNHEVEDATYTTTDAWIGYQTEAGLISVGARGDSALDAIDAAHDKTVEFGYSVNDASDVGSFVKFEGKKNVIQYGVSYYEDRNNDDENLTGMNGYIGYVGPKLMVNVGMEMNNAKLPGSIESIYMVNTSYQFGAVGLGASYGYETLKQAEDREVFGVSAGYNLSEVAYIGAGYHFADGERDAVNVGGKYYVTPRFTAMFDLAVSVSDEAKDVGTKSGDVQTFARLDYKF